MYYPSEKLRLRIAGSTILSPSFNQPFKSDYAH